MTESMAPGWYGKIPALGDFASRRLPEAFIGTWDSWLQHSMAASRARLGERWLDIYLTSPIWRFALMPETLGGSAWAGILMPSVDKVGRHFPLTLAVELALGRDVDPVSAMLAADDWFAALERIALSALDAEFSVDDLERELAQAPFPLDAQGDGADGGTLDALAQWWLHPTAAPQAVQLPPERSALDLLTSTAQRVFAASAIGKSIWWSTGGESRMTEVNLIAGLPDEDYFSGLLLGIEWRDQPATA